MAKLSKKEVGELCGIDPKNIAVYIGRGKLDLNENGEIDSEDPKNKIFIEKYSRKAEVKKMRVAESTIPARKVSEVIKSAKVDSDGTLLMFEKLERQKLELQGEELAGKVLKLKLANEKMLGAFIPTEQVKFLTIQLSEAIHLAWENELDDVLMKVAAKYGMSREEISEIKKEKTEHTNTARQKAIQTTKTMLRRIQAEVALERGRGEHG